MTTIFTDVISYRDITLSPKGLGGVK